MSSTIRIRKREMHKCVSDDKQHHSDAEDRHEEVRGTRIQNVDYSISLSETKGSPLNGVCACSPVPKMSISLQR